VGWLFIAIEELGDFTEWHQLKVWVNSQFVVITNQKQFLSVFKGCDSNHWQLLSLDFRWSRAEPQKNNNREQIAKQGKDP
jgi:hypothetical protein